jgi:hypothetical protein
VSPVVDDLHGGDCPDGRHGDQAVARCCPRCSETVANLGVHLRYRCPGQPDE